MNFQEISPEIKQIIPSFPESLDYSLPNNSSIQKFKNERYINDLFDLITQENLEDIEVTDLKENKFNSKDGEIENLNTNEFNLINNILKKGEKITIDENIKESNAGKIVMYGYFRYLRLNNFYELELNELFKKYKVGDWVSIQDNLIIGLQDFTDKHEKIIHNRFTYYCSLICYVIPKEKTNDNVNEMNKKDLENFILPVYKDKNGDLCVPSFRRIVNYYFTFLNISKKISFLEFDRKNRIFNFYFGERFNIMKYHILGNNLNHIEFPSYYNQESMDELLNLEKEI
jgi:hypothetical protein